MAPVRREVVRRSGRVVEGDGLENRSAKAPGVRIPPPPPTERRDRGRAAPGRAPARRARVVAASRREVSVGDGVHRGRGDPRIVVGAPEGEADLRDADPDRGRRRLGEAGSGEGDAGSPAALAGAGRRRGVAPGLAAARAAGWTRSSCLQRIRKGGPVRIRPRAPATGASSPPWRTTSSAGCSRAATASTPPSGHHARFLETWAAWGRRTRHRGGDLPDGGGRARRRCPRRSCAWARAPAAGLLPWLAAR